MRFVGHFTSEASYHSVRSGVPWKVNANASRVSYTKSRFVVLLQTIFKTNVFNVRLSGSFKFTLLILINSHGLNAFVNF